MEGSEAGGSGSPAGLQSAFAATLVDEWVRGGVRHAVCCPGSRSTPLAGAVERASAEGLLELHVRLDERSAAFFALGLAMRSQMPPLLVTTSGTAAAELHAAVVEASMAGVPMVVCTADRPPELHHVGAPQTVDQDRLFGSAVRWYAAPGVPRPGAVKSWRPLASRALAEAAAGPRGPGPVHLNLAFTEPLWAEPTPLALPRGGQVAWHRSLRGNAGAPAGVVERLARPGIRGLVVAGAGSGDPAAVVALSDALGWPMLADPRAGIGSHPNLVTAADALLRRAGEQVVPDVVVRLGRPPASRVLGEWLERSGAEQVLVDPWWQWAEPSRSFSLHVSCDPSALCWDVAAAAGTGRHDGGDWLARWQRAEASAQDAIEAALERDPDSEPAIVRALWQSLGSDDTLAVASSLPIRHLEWFGGPRPQPPRVLANRGANGIDGTLSTALGASAATRGGRVWVLLGDLAFFHDAGALLGARGWRAGLDVVVLDNAGGGIFSLLPQAAQFGPAEFERLFGTPQDADVCAVAAGYGATTQELRSRAQLRDAACEPPAPGDRRGVRVWRARTRREHTVELLNRIWDRIDPIG